MSSHKENFKVCTWSIHDTKSKYVHWSEGLKMHIEKDGVSIILNSEEVEQLVKSLPQTVGGTY